MCNIDKKHYIGMFLTFILLLFSGCTEEGSKDYELNNSTLSPEANIVEQKVPSQEQISEKSQIVREEKNRTEKKSQIKVTFVELGSVKCVPCKMMQPIMEEIEKEYAEQVKVVFHDVWTAEGKPYAQKYRIRAIPTQIFLDKDDKEYFRHQGYFPKDELVKVLKMQGVE